MNFLNTKSNSKSVIKRVYHIIITVGKVSSHEDFAKCGSSRPQVFCKVVALKNVAKFDRKTSVPDSFDEVLGRRP